MANGWCITAQKIKEWTKSNRRQAQDTLPLLVRKLILASLKPSLLSFPARDSVSSGGWDGRLISEEGNAFVPEGSSVWEFGTEESVNTKANEDYEKRTKNPLGIDKKSTTFVFVTSRAWTKRDSWAQEKGVEGQWGQVRGLNADDLEAWLEQCPAAHRWFARLIGGRPGGARDIEQAWDCWSCATQPKCNADLVLAGREDQAKELANKLKAEPSVIHVWGESEDEAYAFALAVVNQHLEFSARFLEVKESNDWDFLLDSQQPLILIPRLDYSASIGLGLATKRGHWVILPKSSRQLSGQKEGITLSKANRDQQIEALISMGLEKKNAEGVVRSCRGYLNPIRRHPTLVPVDYRKPDWASPKNPEPLLAALLAGAWVSDNTNDCDQVAQLAGIPYEELEKQLHIWAITDDPPVRLTGNVWQIVSRQDAWPILSPFINAGTLERFGQVTTNVLQELDPRFKLPPEERWMPNVSGKVVKHSVNLRQGLAEMLSMLASYGDRDCKIIGGGHSLQDSVSWWVRQLLIEDMSGHRWYSLNSVLPYLGEAAPNTFLGLPFNKAVFDFLKTLPSDVTSHYWKKTGYYLQEDDEEHANWVIEQLLAHKIPFAAIDASAHYLLGETAVLDGDLLARVLELAVIEPTDHELVRLDGYKIVKIFKSIQFSDDVDHVRLGRIEWMYLPIFCHNDIQPLVLMEEIKKNPNFFVYLIRLAFKADPSIEAEFSELSSELKEKYAENARNLLNLTDQLPGQDGQGVDAAQLQEWVEAVRQECVRRNRSSIGDYYIGELLSHSPVGNDGVWPHEAVRGVIERYENRDIERGIEFGIYNQGNVTIRSLREGGKQERELAEKYKQQAEEIQYTYPRTSAILRRIADDYKRDGIREDTNVELRD